MKKATAIKVFGTQRKLAEALRVSQQAISRWPEDVPKWWRPLVREAIQSEKERRRDPA